MKKIISVGFEIPGYSESYERYDSSQSLLDADIVVFEPDFSCYFSESFYEGERRFDETISFLIGKHTQHWKSEISTALQDGKTVFVLMREYEKIFVHAWETKTSGKPVQVKNTASPYDNYKFLPVRIPALIPRRGSEIIPGDNGLFAVFWNEFKEHLRYECYMNGEIEKPLFFTKTGRKPLGGVFREGKGNLVLLPPIR